MKTAAEVLAKFGRGVLIHRHAKYLQDPEGRKVDNINEALALNLSRRIQDNHFPLSQAGRDVSEAQGRLIAKWRLAIDSILVSRNGRGPETGLYIATGMALVENDNVPPIHFDARINYPMYNSEGLEAWVDRGNAGVVEWLNGKHPDLCTETPEQFILRVQDLVGEYFTGHWLHGKLSVLISTHMEIVTLIHRLFVEGSGLGQMSESGYFPDKSTGILLVKDGYETKGFAYDQDFNIIQEPSW